MSRFRAPLLTLISRQAGKFPLGRDCDWLALRQVCLTGQAGFGHRLRGWPRGRRQLGPGLIAPMRRRFASQARGAAGVLEKEHLWQPFITKQT